MLAAFTWGFLAAATLIAGGAYALRRRIGDRALGVVMAFGSGVLISSVAYELVPGSIRHAPRQRRRRRRSLRRLGRLLRRRHAANTPGPSSASSRPSVLRLLSS
jgi:hypothetical protein